MPPPPRCSYLSPPPPSADPQAWQRLLQAIRDVGFTEDNITDITRAMGAICVMGLIDFDDDGCDGSVVADRAPLTTVAQLLGLSVDALNKAFVTTKTQVRNETFIKSNTISRVRFVGEMGCRS